MGADSKQQQREQAQQAALAAALHHNNNNSISQQNNNNNNGSSHHHQKGGAGSAAASLTAAYENILYSQLTKGTTTPTPTDTLNNNHHHHLNHHLSHHHHHQPIDLNIGSTTQRRQHEGDPKPEDLSNHHGKEGGGSLANGEGRRSRYNSNHHPSRPSSASSIASASSIGGAHHRSALDDRMLQVGKVKIEESLGPLEEERQLDMMDDDVELDRKSVGVSGTGEEALPREHDQEEMEEVDEEVVTESRLREEEDEDELANDKADDEDDEEGVRQKDQLKEVLTDDGEERKESTVSVGGKRRRSSTGTASAKEVLDNILYSSNSNDRTIDSTSSPAVTPSPMAMVRERSVSPADGSGSNHAEDHMLANNKSGGSVTGDDLKSDLSDDSNPHHPVAGPASSPLFGAVASVAVADIRNSAQAVEHGEKFLKWLEACSDPNVTAMQVMQFKYLLNSIKLSAERQQLQTTAASGGGSFGGAGPEERTRIRKRK